MSLLKSQWSTNWEEEKKPEVPAEPIPSPEGQLNVEELKEKIESGEIHTVTCLFEDCEGRPKGKQCSAQDFLDNVLEKGKGACSAMYSIDHSCGIVPTELTNWATGFGDWMVFPDVESMYFMSWRPGNIAVFNDVYFDASKANLVSISPRNILKAQKAAAEKAGYAGANAASELEFHMFDQSIHEIIASGFRDLKYAGSNQGEDYNLLWGDRKEPLMSAFRKHCKESGLRIESTKGEVGSGQHELNLHYCDPVHMADRHTLMKLMTKVVAEDQGKAVTYMAKVGSDMQGSSGHLHFSLTNADGSNAFAGDEPLCEGVTCSILMKQFLAGWIKYIDEVFPFFAPTVNSYKRFAKDSWAPVNKAWSYDNRSCGFRCVGEGQSVHIECRIPGSDVHPYLAFAAAYACGLRGIAEKLELPAMQVGSQYIASDPEHEIPRTFEQSLEKFKASAFARESFGDAVVDHYYAFGMHQVGIYKQTVMQWEKEWYLDQI